MVAIITRAGIKKLDNGLARNAGCKAFSAGASAKTPFACMLSRFSG